MWYILMHTIVYCIAAVSLLEIAIIDIGGLLSKFIISPNAKKPLPQLVGKGDKAPFFTERILFDSDGAAVQYVPTRALVPAVSLIMSFGAAACRQLYAVVLCKLEYLQYSLHTVYI